MAKDGETGLRGALKLDDAAQALAEAIGDDGDELQLDAFAGSHPLGKVKDGAGKSVSTGPGRPKGSRNRRTSDIAKLISATGRDPLIALAQIGAMPIDALAQTLECSKAAAFDRWVQVQKVLAEYTHQKLPTAVQVTGANAGALVINMGAPVDGDTPLEQLFGQLIDVTPEDVASDPDMQENQALSGDDEAPSHDNASHEKGK